MKKFLLLFALLFLPTSAQAVTRYVSPTGSGTTCSEPSPCTLATGLSQTAGADTLILKNGTYASRITGIPSGTSVNARTIIKAENNGSAVLEPGSGATSIIDASGISYVEITGLVIDGSGTTGGDGIGVDDHTVQGWLIQDNTVRDIIHHGILIDGSGHIIRRNTITNFGQQTLAGDNTHGIYLTDSDVTVEANTIDGSGTPGNLAGYCIHQYNTAGGANNNIIKNNVAKNCQRSGIITGSGSGNQVFGNLVHDNPSGNSLGGILVGGSNTKVWNNTIYNNNGKCIANNASSSATIKNNLCSANNDNTIEPTGTVSNNLTGTQTAASHFVNAGAGNFSLISTSTAINAGIAAIATGITACANGSAPDIGAIESMPNPTATVNGTAAVITTTNNCTNSVLPATSATGFSFRKNAAANAIVGAVNRTGSNSFSVTLTNAFIAGDTCDFTYAQSTGNVFSNNNIGNLTTSNQELFDFTNITCTNITSGTGSVHLSHWRFYKLQGSADTAWTPLDNCAEDAANCTCPPGCKFWVRLKVRNNSGTNYPPFNYRTRVRYNGGSYVTLTDSYVNGIKALGTGAQLGTVINEGTILTADQLTSNETTNVNGIAVRAAVSIPALTLNNLTETELAQALDIATTPAAGDTFEFCPYDDTGTALTCATPAKITIGSYGGAR